MHVGNDDDGFQIKSGNDVGDTDKYFLQFGNSLGTRNCVDSWAGRDVRCCSFSVARVDVSRHKIFGSSALSYLAVAEKRPNLISSSAVDLKL